MTTTTLTRRVRKLAAPTDWMQYGLCCQTDPNLFFPEGRGAAITVQTEQAKQVCNRCPVKASCLEWAVETEQAIGVWGGLSEDDRRVLLRQRSEQRQSGYERCIEQQEFLERRTEEGASHRDIAGELGVCHTSVGRALRLFRAERDQAGQEVAAV